MEIKGFPSYVFFFWLIFLYHIKLLIVNIIYYFYSKI